MALGNTRQGALVAEWLQLASRASVWRPSTWLLPYREGLVHRCARGPHVLRPPRSLPSPLSFPFHPCHHVRYYKAILNLCSTRRLAPPDHQFCGRSGHTVPPQGTRSKLAATIASNLIYHTYLQTSKRLFAMSKLRWVWYDAMKRHVIQKGLPIPAAAIGDLRALTAEHLEARAVHAAHFHDNWSSPHPVARKAVEFCAVNYLDDELPDEQRAAVTHISFLPGRNGQYLITAVGRVLTCWEIPLGESEAYRVAEWVSARRIEQVVVNDDPKAEVVVAYVSEHPAT